MADPIRLNTNPIWPSVNFPDADFRGMELGSGL